MDRVKTHQLRHRHRYHVTSFTNFVDLGLTGRQACDFIYECCRFRVDRSTSFKS